MKGNINPFVLNAPSLHPWKHQGVEKECIGNKWVKGPAEDIDFTREAK